ncbi:MAG: type I 3-dehydroquinate dehydratase [Bacteroidales bacterium]|nr:type I 3-dehydroquinate dehydratase [Bacteroidales bacterium]
MICVSLHNKSFDELVSLLDGGEIRMAEICLDDCELDDEQVGYLFSTYDLPLIASVSGWTCSMDQLAQIEHLLEVAIEAGAAYVDIPVNVPPQLGKRLCRKAREEGTTVIRSFTDETKTPPLEQLQGIYDKCRRFGAEVVRLGTRVRNAEDWLALTGVIDNNTASAQPVLTVLDPIARESAPAANDPALEALSLGVPFVYARSLEDATALAKAVYGDRKPYDREGLRMPSSKSFAQRAIIAAALAEGTSRLEGYTPCLDNEAALRVARELGANVVEERGSLTITGLGQLISGSGRLDIGSISAGESGLMARLLIPLLSVIGNGNTTLTGERTLLKRPLKGAADIMAPFGVLLKPAQPASVTQSAQPSSDRPGASSQPAQPSSDRPSVPSHAGRELRVPLTISGELIPGRAEISGADGSQLISGLLMALPLTGKSSTIYVQDPKSIPYMFITLDVMRKFGVTVTNEMEGDSEFVETGDWALCTQIDFKVKAPQKYKAAQFTIEGDWSAAANFLVAGALFGSVSIDGLASDSLQADLAIMDILVEAGAVASQDEDGRINVGRAPLRPITVDMSNSPDIFPIVSILACFCPGESRLKGVGRLATKESDRAKAILDTLTQMGVQVSIEGDELVIEGHSLEQRLLTGTLLKGGNYTTYHDHRMLMALRVAELGADSPIEVDDEECVAKSFPGFQL